MPAWHLSRAGTALFLSLLVADITSRSWYHNGLRIIPSTLLQVANSKQLELADNLPICFCGRVKSLKRCSGTRPSVGGASGA